MDEIDDNRPAMASAKDQELRIGHCRREFCPSANGDRVEPVRHTSHLIVQIERHGSRRPKTAIDVERVEIKATRQRDRGVVTVAGRAGSAYPFMNRAGQIRSRSRLTVAI